MAAFGFAKCRQNALSRFFPVFGVSAPGFQRPPCFQRQGERFCPKKSTFWLDSIRTQRIAGRAMHKANPGKTRARTHVSGG